MNNDCCQVYVEPARGISNARLLPSDSAYFAAWRVVAVLAADFIRITITEDRTEML